MSDPSHTMQDPIIQVQGLTKPYHVGDVEVLPELGVEAAPLPPLAATHEGEQPGAVKIGTEHDKQIGAGARRRWLRCRTRRGLRESHSADNYPNNRD